MSDLRYRDGLWLGLRTSAKVDHREWLSGVGVAPADVMIIGGSPNRYEIASRFAFAGDTGKLLCTMLQAEGIDTKKLYLTYSVKYGTGKTKPTAADIRTCKPYLLEEIRRVQPKIIVCMGKDALEAVAKGTYKFSVIRGTPVPYNLDDDKQAKPAPVVSTEDDMFDEDTSYGAEKEPETTPSSQITLLATFNPAYLDIAPRETAAFKKELLALGSLIRGLASGVDTSTETAQKLAAVTKYTVLNRANDLKALKQLLFSSNQPQTVTLDCEWHGDSWYVKNKFLRTVQLGFADGSAVVIEFTGAKAVDGGYTPFISADDPTACFAALKEILEDPRLRIVGHNVKEDGLWLLAHGIDIRPRVVYDTMLAEALINQAGPFGLEELALKYTSIPRWSVELESWKAKAGGKWHSGGYGFIPSEILNPYAALDVIATYCIYEKQQPMMAEFETPRGENYPSLWASVIQAQNNLYEVESVGLPVDKEMLDNLINVFEPKVSELKADLVKSAAELGLDKFNPDSSKDVTKLLFDTLQITPFKTTKKTGGKLWQEAVHNFSVDAWDADSDIAPATDAMSLTILEHEHPVVASLLNYRRVGQIRKTWLRHPDENGEGGLYSCVGADGRLHPRLSLLTETGRLRSAKPNSQNFPKKAQKFLGDIFKKELKENAWLAGEMQGKMPSIRQIVVPLPGHIFIEGDFVQAELFTMAALSGDEQMMTALTTPGLDLHDKTAIDGFGIQVLFASNRLHVEEAWVIERAGVIWNNHGGGTPDFDKEGYESELGELFAGFVYVDQTSREMVRDEFKNGPRVSAKAINFGIPYGRGAGSIASQIKSETGSPESISSLTNTVQKMLDSWKTVSYPTAWAYMEQCSRQAVEQWKVTNPWGRSRRFAPTTNRKLLAEYGRQGSNFPIQSTVADTCLVGMQLMVEERARRGLSFKICNQVHDAVMSMVPIAEIQPTLQLYRDTLGAVAIPLVGRAPLVLGIDLDKMSRWGKKYKEAKKAA